jgi:cystathionine beta-lyase
MAPDFASLAPPVWRASTVVFKSLDDFVERKSRLPDGYTYGTSGTPTHRLLEQEIARLDQAEHCVLAPSGQAAICLTLLCLLRSGDHLLINDAAYGTARAFALNTLANLGVQIELYAPRSSSADLAQRIRPNTRLIWLESPGSVTMEVQDVTGIAQMAQQQGVLTVMDNTWASPLGLTPLALGVDVCIHACTKYMNGHSDLLMGSISTRDTKLYTRLRAMQAQMGQAPSAEDCYLVLRGLQTMALRWSAQGDATLTVARYLQTHSQVAQLFFPGLPGAPDHALWRAQYRGVGCLVAFVPKAATLPACRAFFSQLRHFAIGASWGGTHSLAAFYPTDDFRHRTHCEVDGNVFRLSIGLEPVSDLIAELDLAFQAYQQHLSPSPALS